MKKAGVEDGRGEANFVKYGTDQNYNQQSENIILQSMTMKMKEAGVGE